MIAELAFQMGVAPSALLEAPVFLESLIAVHQRLADERESADLRQRLAARLHGAGA